MCEIQKTHPIFLLTQHSDILPLLETKQFNFQYLVNALVKTDGLIKILQVIHKFTIKIHLFKLHVLNVKK